MTEIVNTQKPKIYLFSLPGGFEPTDVIGYALAEDGHCICSHLSSNVQWAKHDMGLTSDWKHDHYNEHYPDGYELIWVDDPDNHSELKMVMELNKKLYESEQP